MRTPWQSASQSSALASARLNRRPPRARSRSSCLRRPQEAYADASVRFDEIDSFVTCAEDLNEGISIFDEYTPDQLGAVQKPMHTLTQDGLHGIADALMQIRSRNCRDRRRRGPQKSFQRPNAGLDSRLCFGSGLQPAAGPYTPRHSRAGNEPLWSKRHHRLPVRSSRRSRTGATRAIIRCPRTRSIAIWREIESSPYLAYPLREAELAKSADGCVVVVVANEAKARQAPSQPLWILGSGFATDSPTLESRDWSNAEYARLSARAAYRQAGIKSPHEVDFFEVDDTYAYKELQHLIALWSIRQTGRGRPRHRGG